MKAQMAAQVARFAEWDPASLETRIKWRADVAKQIQRELAAMRKAQRVQRKREAA